MIELALVFVAGILVLGVLFVQKNHYDFLERQQNFITPESIRKEMEDSIQLLHTQAKVMEKLASEVLSLKERVDALTLRAGFRP